MRHPVVVVFFWVVFAVLALAGAGCSKPALIGAKQVGANPQAYAGQTLRSSVSLGGHFDGDPPIACFLYDTVSGANEVQAFVLRAPDKATFEKLLRLDKAAGKQGVIVTYKVDDRPAASASSPIGAIVDVAAK